MTTDEAIIERLDLLVAAFKLAYAPQISEAREQVRRDPVAASILDTAAEDWIAAGELQEATAKACGVTTRTVRKKLQDLVALGALRQEGWARSSQYRSTGLL